MTNEKFETNESPAESQAAEQNQEALHQEQPAQETEKADSTSEQMSESDQLKKELADWKDKYTRLFAEFDNFRKRNAKERIEILQTAGSDIIKELLPILDDFDRAAKANENLEDVVVIKEGFSLIHNKLYKRLESRGLKPIQCMNQPFDTDFHEAITSIPAPEESLKGKVVDEVEKGYVLHDKVIRFSKVVIGQ